VTAAVLAAALAVGVRAEAPPVGPAGPVTAEALMRLGQAQLDELMAKAEPGPLPDGAAVGIANRDPGSSFGGFTRGFFKGLWEGKTFDRANGTLTNRTAFGRTGSARVYHGVSKVDGKPCIVFDYSKSDNLLARHVYDEVRLVAPGLYLGIAYLRVPTFHKWIYFALQFPQANPEP
jgi:hypothetical protein